MSGSKENDFHLLRRITVLDRQCSAPLYDKILSWKTDDTSPGTAAKLISLFNSIALTFNDVNKTPDGKVKDANDRIRRVIFEQSIEQQRKSKSHYNKYSTGLPSLGGRTNTSKASTSASRFMMAQNQQSQNNSELEIFFQTTGSIHVAIFFKPAYYIEDGWEPQLLRDISHDFLLKYEDRLKELEGTFQKMAKDQEAARNNYDYMPPFKDFEPIIDNSSGFTLRDVSSVDQVNKKIDLGTHILPLSSDLVLSSTPQAVGLASNMGPISMDHDMNQPRFLPQMQSSITPRSQDEDIVREQRNQRRALQQGLQPPTSSTHHGEDSKGGLSGKKTPSAVPTPTAASIPTPPAPQAPPATHHAPPPAKHESLKNHDFDDDDLDGMEDD
jgi:hypothetical protein